MASKTSKTLGVRLPLTDWAEVEHAAKLHGRTRNEEIRWRIAQHRVEMPPEACEGQASIFDERV